MRTGCYDEWHKDHRCPETLELSASVTRMLAISLMLRLSELTARCDREIVFRCRRRKLTSPMSRKVIDRTNRTAEMRFMAKITEAMLGLAHHKSSTSSANVKPESKTRSPVVIPLSVSPQARTANERTGGGAKDIVFLSSVPSLLLLHRQTERGTATYALATNEIRPAYACESDIRGLLVVV